MRREQPPPSPGNLTLVLLMMTNEAGLGWVDGGRGEILVPAVKVGGKARPTSLRKCF